MKILNGKAWMPIAAICVLLAGCASTDWQKAGATEQDYAADFSACDGYIAQDDGATDATIDLSADRRTRMQPKLAAWRQRRITGHHSRTTRHAGGGHSNNNNDVKAEAAAVAAVMVVGAIIGAAERAELHDECMVALGWNPPQPGSTPVLVASASSATDGPGALEQSDPPEFMRLPGEPAIGQEPLQHITVWQVVPPEPPAKGLTCTSTYPRLHGC
jgi:hypothetical protein